MTISTCASKIRSTRSPLVAFALVASATPLAGCGGSDTGEGTVRVTVYGEEFIEEGIDPSEMEDGWAIEFERFEVTVSGVQVGGEEVGDSVTIDVSASSDGAGHEIGAILVPAGNHADSSFTIERVEVEGSGTRGDVTKTFHWAFETPVTYAECETTTSIKEGETATFQITVHADHLFYDSLVSASPELLFSPLADADVDDDGEITEEELAQADIGSYDPGNEDANDLWSFLSSLNATMGHVDGEGHCHAQAIDE